MKTFELFDRWAPPQVVWSRWAKPVLFAEMSAVPAVDQGTDPLPDLGLEPDSSIALIVDLPGAASVKAGLALLDSGFRPVPLFNGTRGPTAPNFASTAILDNDAILGWLYAGSDSLERKSLPINAPPAFLLDSRRKTLVSLTPGRFDNRWIVFPQDFPSANFLKSQGISQAMLIQQHAGVKPQDDLVHVLRRWQEGGISLFVYGTDETGDVQPLVVQKPSRFRALWYTAVALAGLHRNSAGGFGSVIPQPSSGAG